MQSGSEAAPGVRDLYRSDNLVVREVATGDRDRWVVTFDNYGIGHGFERLGFGQAWLQAQGVSAIHVMGRAEDWYQYEDVGEALAVVRSAMTGASRIITYGSSMGGYGAVRFADAVGAQAVVALSPQYTLDPAVAGHDARWSQDVDKIRWLPEFNGPLRCKARIVVAFDPVGLDGWHGRHILGDAGGVGIRLPHTAHPVASFLSEIGLLGELLLKTLDDELDPTSFRRTARERRPQSSVYLGELALSLPPRRLDLALKLARRAVAVNPAGMHSRVSLARLLGRAELHEEALEHLETLTTTSGRSIVYLVEQANGLALAGRTEAAQAIVEEVLSQHGDAAHLYGWAANIAWTKGEPVEAQRLIESAIRLDPTNPGYQQSACTYRYRPSLWKRLKGRLFQHLRPDRGIQPRPSRWPPLSGSAPRS